MQYPGDASLLSSIFRVAFEVLKGVVSRDMISDRLVEDTMRFKAVDNMVILEAEPEESSRCNSTTSLFIAASRVFLPFPGQ